MDPWGTLLSQHHLLGESQEKGQGCLSRKSRHDLRDDT